MLRISGVMLKVRCQMVCIHREALRIHGEMGCICLQTLRIGCEVPSIHGEMQIPSILTLGRSHLYALRDLECLAKWLDLCASRPAKWVNSRLSRRYKKYLHFFKTPR